MQMNATEIMSCEDAAFNAYWGPSDRVMKLRMTVDWFDFSIEHMSKWHKIFNLYEEEEVFQKAIEKFDQYMSMSSVGGGVNLHSVDPSFRDTIAVIAFLAYKEDKSPDKAYKLTLVSLGSTLESLRRAGFGRVVVVGLDVADKEVVHDTVHHWQQLHSAIEMQNNEAVPAGGNIGTIGQTEVAFVQGSLEIAKAKWVQKNVPKAAVGGLHKAFQMAAEKSISSRSETEAEYIQAWLGSKESSWKYVFLTEPDCILLTRPSSLRQLKEQVDQGMVLTPHRLQPIPHESDAKGCSKDFVYLPDSFAPVLDLDPIGEHDVCCDDWKGHGTKPGLPPVIPDCGNFWYMCDFHPANYKREGAHERLKPYSLMRLKHGTGIVSLAASEHGRPCKPQKQSVCLPKT